MELDLGTLSGKIALDTTDFEKSVATAKATLSGWAKDAEKTATTTGKTVSDGMGKGAEQAAQRTSKATDTAKAAYDKAAKAAEEASQRQDSAARKVDVAETKLTETRQKYAAGSSQVKAAEDRLISARQQSTRADEQAAEAKKKAIKASEEVAKAAVSEAEAQKKTGVAAEQAATKGSGAMSRLKASISSMSRRSNPFSAFPSQAKTAGDESGARFGSGFQSSAKSGLASFGAMFKASFLGNAASSALTSGIGAIKSGLASGFGRLESIDQATAKLTGLGNSANTTKTILNNALASVKGTAYGMGDAATVAASMTASGIKPGQDLEKTLSLVADTATIAGRSVTDIGAIFGSVAAKGKLQGDDLLQLTSSGVPVLQFLGQTMHKTSAEVSDLSSKGKISFADFQKAMQAGLGGSAKSSGDTFTGAMANAKAALGRLTASVMGGAFKQMPGAFKGITTQIDAMAPAAERAGAKVSSGIGSAFTTIKGLYDLMAKGDYTASLGKSLGIEEDSPVVGTLLRLRQTFIDFGSSVKTAVSGVVSAFGPMAAEAAKLAGTAALGALSAVMKIVTPLFNALGNSLKQHPTIWRTVAASILGAVVALKAVKTAVAIGGLLTKLGGGFKMVGTALKFLPGTIKLIRVAMVQMNMAFLASPVTWIIAGIVALGAAFVYAYKHSDTFRRIVNGALNGVKNAALAVGRWFSGPFLGFFKAIPGFFTGLWTSVQSAFKAGIDAVVTFVKSYWPVIAVALTGGMALLPILVAKFWPQISAAFRAGITAVATVVRTVGSAISGAWNAIWNTVKNSWVFKVMNSLFSLQFRLTLLIFRVALRSIQAIWNSVWGALRWFVTTELNGIKVIIHGAMTLIRTYIVPILNGIRAVWNAVWSAVAGFARSVWNSIYRSVSLKITQVQMVIVRVMNAVRAVWNAAWSAVRNFVTPIWNGIFNVVRSVLNGISGFISTRIGNIRRNWTSGFNAVRSTAASVMGSIHSVIKSVMDKISKAFGDGVAAIGKVWNGLQDVAKKPIRFVLNTVINHALIGSLRWIEGKLGADQTPYLPSSLTNGFREGGPTGNVGVNEVAGVVHGREFVMDADTTSKAGGASGMEAIRGAIQSGSFPGFKDGGYTGGSGSLTSLAASKIRAAAGSLGWVFQLAQQGWRPRTSYSGTSHAGDAVDVSGPAGGTRLWSIRDALRRQNWAAWVRGPKEGYSWHVHAVPGPGAGTGKGSAVYQWSDYLNGGNGLHGSGQSDPYAKPSGSGGSWLGQVGSAVASLFGKFSSPVDWIKDKFSKLTDITTKFGSSDFVKMIAQVPKKLASAAISKVTGLFGSSSQSTASSNMETWRPLVKQALAASGIGSGTSDENLWLRQIMTESSGNPNLIQSSSLRDINVMRGDPARGLVQVPGVTWADFGRDQGPFASNWMNPFKNLIVGMRAAFAQHGGSAWRNAIGKGHGYGSGTTSATPGWHMVGEYGPELRWFNGGEGVLNAGQTEKLLRLKTIAQPTRLTTPTATADRGSVQMVRIADGAQVDITPDGKATFYNLALEAIDDTNDANRRRGASV